MCILNRPSVLLWLSVNVGGKKRFRFALPLFLPSLLMLTDEAEDLLLFINLVSFGGLKRSGLFAKAMWGINIAYSLFDEIILHTEPCNLVDVDVKKDGGVRVICRLI